METLIDKGFIGGGIDKDAQVKNLIDFIKYIEYNLNTQENTQSIYYKDLFNQCISEIEKPDQNSKITEEAYPYILTLYYLVKQKQTQQNNDEFTEILRALTKVRSIILSQRNQQEITEKDKFHNLFQQISGDYPKNVCKILQFVYQDLIVGPYTQNSLTTYTQLQITELNHGKETLYYQDITSTVKQANDSTTQNLVNNTQETTVLDFLKKKYSNFNSKDDDERRKEFFKFVNNVIINGNHLPYFTNEGESYNDYDNNIDALSPYFTVINWYIINQYNKASKVHIEKFMEPDDFTYFNKTKQSPINIFINDFINGNEYLKINQEALDKLKEAFSNNTALKALTLESYYKNVLNHNISQVNRFFHNSQKNQYIEQTIQIIPDYLEIKGVPENDQDPIIEELKALKNSNSFEKFLDALTEYLKSIIGKDRVTQWEDAIINPQKQSITDLSQSTY